MKPDFDCSDVASSLTGVNCRKYICDNFPKWEDRDKYMVQPPPESLVMYYDPPLICENEAVQETMAAMPYAGSLIGLLLFSWVADNYGRKIAIYSAWISGAFGSLLVGLSFYK